MNTSIEETENKISNGEGLTHGAIVTSGDKVVSRLGAATNIVWGIGKGMIPESFLPVQGAPEGTQRIVLEQKQPAKIWIKNKDSVRCWVLEINDGKLWVKDHREVKAVYAHEFPEIKFP